MLIDLIILIWRLKLNETLYLKSEDCQKQYTLLTKKG